MKLHHVDVSAHMLLLMNVTSHSNNLLEKRDTNSYSCVINRHIFLTVYCKLTGMMVSHLSVCSKGVFDDSRVLVTGQKQVPA